MRPFRSPDRGGRLCNAANAALLPGLLLALTGCAGLVGGPATGPDGLALRDHHLRGLVSDGRYDLAYERVAEGGTRVADALLRFQYEGLLAHYAGRYGRSNASLQAAAALAEKRYTRSLTKSALSLVTNDRIMAYRPPATERLLIHYYGALNYLGMGDPEGAGVEARRLSHLLDLYADRGELDGPGGQRLRAALRYVAGAAFEAIGEANDAAVAYRLARRLDDAGRLPAAGGLERASAAGGLERASSAGGLERASSAGAATVSGADEAAPEAWGEVLVIVERGFAAHRVERGATFLVWPDEVETLRGASTRGRLVADDPAAELALGLASRVLAGQTGATPRGAQRAESEGAEAAARKPSVRLPRVLRVAWPAYARSAPPRPYGGRVWLLARASVGSLAKGGAAFDLPPGGFGSTGPSAGQSGAAGSPTPVALTGLIAGAAEGTDVAWIGDISGALIEHGRRREPANVARAIVRAAAKLAIARGIEEELEEEDETLGAIAGTLLSTAGALTERADTRCWNLLPDEIGLVRLRLPAGAGHLELQQQGLRGRERLDLGEVRVRPGRLVLVRARDRV